MGHKIIDYDESTVLSMNWQNKDPTTFEALKITSNDDIKTPKRNPILHFK